MCRPEHNRLLLDGGVSFLCEEEAKVCLENYLRGDRRLVDMVGLHAYLIETSPAELRLGIRDTSRFLTQLEGDIRAFDGHAS